MPILSAISARNKCDFFLRRIPKTAQILEIGCGSRWVGEFLRRNGCDRYVGIDLTPPADIVGDIRGWRELGLAPASFDEIVAFEVIEHVDCFQECFDLLKPGGRFHVTSPVPERDWILKILEAVHLNQKRTSPHDFLIDFRRIPLFELIEYRRMGGLAQWGIFRKPTN
jgi:SAM-dependent methyltransferase